MFKGKKSKENIKTYKKALRQDLVSGSKAPARLRCQSCWHSHLTAVRMQRNPTPSTSNSHSCHSLQLLSTTLALGIFRHLLSSDLCCSPPQETLLSVLPRLACPEVGGTRLAAPPADADAALLRAQPGRRGVWEAAVTARLGGCRNRMPAAGSRSGRVPVPCTALLPPPPDCFPPSQAQD